jgi:alkaline phosphatase
MATGSKVNNGVLGLALPGDGHELRTILEYARDMGRATGLVTTAPITHATPAGFGAHALSRTLVDEIAADLLTGSHPNLLLGGGGEGMTPAAATQASYNMVTDRAGLLALTASEQVYLSGQFGVGGLPYEIDGLGALPHLSDMTHVALRALARDPDGFFLMVEGGEIDWAAHKNDILRMVGEVRELSKTVSEILQWAEGRSDTLVIVVADHETGGLQVLAGQGEGQPPEVRWSTTGHTGANVPVYLSGVHCSLLPAVIDNTQLPAILSGGNFP